MPGSIRGHLLNSHQLLFSSGAVCLKCVWERPRQVSFVKNVCLRAWGFWNLRTHTIYASCVLVRSLRIQCSRVLNVLILNVKAPMRSSIRIWPSSWEMSDKLWVVLFGSHCFRGMAKTRIAGFVGLRCSFRAIGTSASVEQRLREFMPLCLDSNTRGHVLLSRLPQRRACMFWLGSSHQEPLHAGVSRNLATVVVRGVLPWLRKRRTGLLSSGPKSSFQMRTSFVFNLETKALESGGRAEKLIAQVAWSPVLSFHSLMIWVTMSSAGVGPLCFLKTNVTAPVYQDILEHFMLPSADQLFKDADFIFQQDVAPAHTAKSPKS